MVYWNCSGQCQDDGRAQEVRGRRRLGSEVRLYPVPINQMIHFVHFASLGYAFHVAAKLSGDVSSFASLIENSVAQADEVDGQFLQVCSPSLVCVCICTSVCAVRGRAQCDGDRGLRHLRPRGQDGQGA